MESPRKRIVSPFWSLYAGSSAATSGAGTAAQIATANRIRTGLRRASMAGSLREGGTGGGATIPGPATDVNDQPARKFSRRERLLMEPEKMGGRPRPKRGPTP